jgi:heterodisulfide reductase subunit A-like polyferredoxin
VYLKVNANARAVHSENRTRMIRTDVLVIGGGPAGLAAGIAARKKGFRVTVADGAKTSNVGTIALNFDRVMIPTLFGWIFAAARETNQDL